MVVGILTASQNVNLPDRQQAAFQKPITQRKKKDNRTYKERQTALEKYRASRRSIWGDLNAHWAKTDRLAADLAVKHGKTLPWMRKQLFQASRVTLKRRAISKYNAWAHCKALVINEGEFSISQREASAHVPQIFLVTRNSALKPCEQLPIKFRSGGRFLRRIWRT